MREDDRALVAPRLWNNLTRNRIFAGNVNILKSLLKTKQKKTPTLVYGIRLGFEYLIYLFVCVF